MYRLKRQAELLNHSRSGNKNSLCKWFGEERPKKFTIKLAIVLEMRMSKQLDGGGGGGEAQSSRLQ